MNPTLPIVEQYYCPGESQSIDRAIHLGRLAAFYPACRDCHHRHDLSSFSQRQRDRLQESFLPREIPPRVFEQRLEISVDRHAATYAGRAGRALAHFLASLSLTSPANHAAADDSSVVLLGHDGRGETAQLISALADGLRYMNCQVADLGSVTAPCLALAIAESNAHGGIYLCCAADGRGSELRFWKSAGVPISQHDGLSELAAGMQRAVDRPNRRFAVATRSGAAGQYLARLRPLYHGLRPLVVAVSSGCRPLLKMLHELSATVGCRLVRIDESAQPPDSLDAGAATHLGIWIDGCGQSIVVYDQHGRRISAAALRQMLRTIVAPEQPSSPVNLESNAASPIEISPAEAYAAMLQRGFQIALRGETEIWLAGDPFSECDSGATPLPCPVPDALLVFTLLLKLLSRSDRPISELVGL